MPGTIRLAALLMLMALLCYTAGGWGERLAGRLRPWHAAPLLASPSCIAPHVSHALEEVSGHAR